MNLAGARLRIFRDNIRKPLYLKNRILLSRKELGEINEA
jgi:hypothetical protein